jgi:hypothetical protein
MRRFTSAAGAAATAAIALSALGNQPTAMAVIAGKTPVVAVKIECPRLVRPKCPKYYAAGCTKHGRGVAFRCCVKMGCVPQPW